MIQTSPVPQKYPTQNYRNPPGRTSNCGTFGAKWLRERATIWPPMVTITQEPALAPLLVRAEGAVLTQGSPEQTRLVIPSAATGGAFHMMQIRIDVPAYGPPYHVHAHEDETFVIQEGSFVFVIDGVRHEAFPGDVVFAPRDVPHRFESGPNGGTMLFSANGDNFERFHPRFTTALAAGEMHLLEGIAADHGITFLPDN